MTARRSSSVAAPRSGALGRRTHGPRLGRRPAAVALAVLLAGGTLAAAGAAAPALAGTRAPVAETGDGRIALEVEIPQTDQPVEAFDVTDAQLRWGLNVETGSGAFYGGCNFLSAGAVGDTGGGRVWTAADGFYRTTDGAVTIEKPYATDGGLTQRRAVPFADRCLDPTGTGVSSSSFVGTGIEAVIEGGTGRVDPVTGDVRIEWNGSVTVVFYGGLTYWWFTDPVLQVSGGRGTLTATAGGFGTDMADMTKWSALPETTVVLADLDQVPLGATGFAATPRYRGVTVDLPAGSSPQVLGTDSAGSFPQSFIDFQALTGQLAYWYSSGGLRDPAKPATTLYVSYDADVPVDPGEGSSGGVTPGPGGGGGGLPDLTGGGSPGSGTGSGSGADGSAGGASGPSAVAPTRTAPRPGAATAVPPTPTVAVPDAVEVALPQAVPAETMLPTRSLIPAALATAVDPRERLALTLAGVFALASLGVVGFPRGWFVLPFTRRP